MTIFILAILAFAVGLILDVTALLCLIGELISQYVIIASLTGLFVVTWISGHLWTRGIVGRSARIITKRSHLRKSALDR